MYKIIQKRKIWLSFSGLLVVASIIALSVWGLKFGIDFTGGSLLEVKFNESRPAVSDVNSALEGLDLGSLVVQNIGDNGMILRFQNTTEEKHQETLDKLRGLVDEDGSEDEEDSEKEVGNSKLEIDGATSTEEMASSTEDKVVVSNLEEMKYDSVGPVIGEELKSKSIQAIIIVLIAIVLFVAWAFKKVSKPVASWKYGLSAIIALFHDVIVVCGAFAVLGEFYNMEVNTPFVAAILTVLGYSVNDSIVVFDRVRENLPKSNDDFETTVNTSVNQTIRRSINTSVTTMLVLLAIVFWGGDSIRGFVLALTIGVFVGTYSSIFLASPVLVVWERLGKKAE